MWEQLSRALPDEALYGLVDDLDSAALGELMELGSRAAAAELSGVAAAAIAARMAVRLGVEVV